MSPLADALLPNQQRAFCGSQLLIVESFLGYRLLLLVLFANLSRHVVFFITAVIINYFVLNVYSLPTSPHVVLLI